MLEYILLIGDVNGSYKIPTFTIDSYNEEDIDVTDYPYTFYDNQYSPDFFIGRWPIRNVVDFLNIKSRSIQYIKMDNIIDSSFLNNALLVAGNYKTAEGVEVEPWQWPVTPVWTSLWLMDELDIYGYPQIDTAFFHAGNYENGSYNPLINNTWNDGVGIINYRGWGDANGWHKPYFHREEVEDLNNGWNLPVVMSFVCNTGDFGNDYSGTGLNKCFGEMLITAGTVTNPKGAAAMVGPSDLDTDTRFNNVICGFMWDALLSGESSELAPALHAGKHALIHEFNGLSAPDGTVIDAFYHHVYAVLGDPSLSVWLLEPNDLNIDMQDNTELTSSYVSLNIADNDGTPLSGVVGALLDSDNELIGKSISNSLGELIIDFDSNVSSELTLFLNAPQYKQKSISLNYISDDGSTYTELLPLDLSCAHVLYAVENDNGTQINNIVDYASNNDSVSYFIRLDMFNNSSETINFNYEITSLSESIYSLHLSNDTVANCPSGDFCCGNNSLCDTDSGDFLHFTIDENAVEGSVATIVVNFSSDTYEIQNYTIDFPISNSWSSYNSTLPSVECDYGYKAYDHTDIDYEEHPVYDWIEINEIGTNLNLTDDSHINDVQIGFDFKYFGETYNSMTICSNGWTSFESCPISHFWNFSIPNPMGPSAMLAPFMDDLDDNGGTVPFNVYAYNTNDGRFIVEWDHVLNGEDDQDCPNCIDETFQMIIFDPSIYPTATGDGDIIFQYKEVYDIDQNGNYATIGIESPDQNDGVEYLFSSFPRLGSYWESSENGAYENIAIKFTTGIASSCTSMDLNNDGIINVVDIIAVINIILGEMPDSTQECAADVNSDGIINVVDIIAIINQIIS